MLPTCAHETLKHTRKQEILSLLQFGRTGSKQIGREAACLLLLFSYFHWQCTSGNNIASAPVVCPPSYYVHNRSIATTDRKQSCTQWSTSKPTFLSSKNLDDGFGSKIWQQTRARSSSYKVDSITLTLLLLLLLPLCFPSLLCYCNQQDTTHPHKPPHPPQSTPHPTHHK